MIRLVTCASAPEGVINMLESKRKKGESFESFLRRFNKRLMQSGIILEFKANRYFDRGANKNLQKRTALERKKYKMKMEFLKKIGKLPEEKLRGKGRGRR
jgi:ribosomal protein S21